MADCVSCGREIPPGKLFCDDCYLRMKGRMGPRRKSETAPEAGVAAGPHYRASATAAGGEKPQETITVLGEAGTPRGGVAKGELTPASQKKVVSMRPRAETATREKGKSRNAKRFTITITFSEKTYERMARLRARLKREGRKRGEKASGEAAAASAARRRRKRGPYGRPLLKAVESSGNAARASRGGFLGWILYRRRPWDRGDGFAAAGATCGTALVLAFCFLEWVRVHWVSQSGASLQVVGVKGTQLGAPVYVSMIAAALAWCFMVAGLLWGGERLKVDFGVVMLLAGLVVIPLVFVALSNNTGVYNAATEVMRSKGVPLPAEASGYERHASWPAYLMVLAGLSLSFSGLVRLSERRAKAPVEGKPDERRKVP